MRRPRFHAALVVGCVVLLYLLPSQAEAQSCPEYDPAPEAVGVFGLGSGGALFVETGSNNMERTRVIAMGDGALLATSRTTRAQQRVQLAPYLARYSSDQQLMWDASFAARDGWETSVFDVAETQDGGAVVVGWSTGYSGPYNWQDRIGFISAVGPDGVPLWTHLIDGAESYDDVLYSVAVGTDGTVYTAGWETDGQKRPTARAYSARGEWLWTAPLPLSADEWEGNGWLIAARPGGGAFVVSTIKRHTSNNRTRLSAIGATGHVLWSQDYATPRATNPVDLVVNDEGTAYVVGNDMSGFHSRAFIMAVREDGDALWSVSSNEGPLHNNGTTPNPLAVRAALAPDGDLVVTGQRTDIRNIGTRPYLTRYAPDGTVRWRTGLDTPPVELLECSNAYAQDIQIGAAGEIYVAVRTGGAYLGFFREPGDLLLQAYAPDGTWIGGVVQPIVRVQGQYEIALTDGGIFAGGHYVGSAEAVSVAYWFDVNMPTASGEAPAPHGDLTIWPNPAREALYIARSSSSALNGDVFDMMGRRVLSADLTSGNESLDLRPLAPGLYVLRERETGASRTFTVL